TEFGGGLDRVHARQCTTNVQVQIVRMNNRPGPTLAPIPPTGRAAMTRSNRTNRLSIRNLVAALALGLCAPLAFAADNADRQAQAGKATADIVDTAVAAGQFNTLAAALTAAGLVDTLKGEG